MNDQDQTNTGVTITAQNGLMSTSVIGANGQELSSILKDNIKRVQENPAYIPQAQAIADQVKEIINLAKVEVEMLKVASTFKN